MAVGSMPAEDMETRQRRVRKSADDQLCPLGKNRVEARRRIALEPKLKPHECYATTAVVCYYCCCCGYCCCSGYCWCCGCYCCGCYCCGSEMICATSGPRWSHFWDFELQNPRNETTLRFNSWRSYTSSAAALRKSILLGAVVG